PNRPSPRATAPRGDPRGPLRLAHPLACRALDVELDAGAHLPELARRVRGLARLRLGPGMAPHGRRREGGRPLASDQKVVQVVRVLLLLSEDVFEQPSGRRVVITEEANPAAVALDRDAFGDEILGDHL